MAKCDERLRCLITACSKWKKKRRKDRQQQTQQLLFLTSSDDMTLTVISHQRSRPADYWMRGWRYNLSIIRSLSIVGASEGLQVPRTITMSAVVTFLSLWDPRDLQRSQMCEGDEAVLQMYLPYPPSHFLLPPPPPTCALTSHLLPRLEFHCFLKFVSVLMSTASGRCRCCACSRSQFTVGPTFPACCSFLPIGKRAEHGEGLKKENIKVEISAAAWQDVVHNKKAWWPNDLSDSSKM